MRPRVATIGRWGVACGMDNYVRSLIEYTLLDIEHRVFASIEDGASDSAPVPLLRDWSAATDDISGLLIDIQAFAPHALHVQFNWGVMSLGALSGLLRFCSDQGIASVVQLHATYDHPTEGSLGRIRDDLQRADCIIVHGEHDLQSARRLGLSRVWRWRLGVKPWPRRSVQEARALVGLTSRSPIVATFGFLQPRKNTLQTIRSIDMLRRDYPDVLLIACAAPHPRGFDLRYYEACRGAVASLGLRGNVEMVVRYLPEDVAMLLLQTSDAIVLPYVDTPEGASAAELVRTDAASIAGSIEEILRGGGLARGLADAAGAFADASAWPNVAVEYVDFLNGLLVSAGPK